MKPSRNVKRIRSGMAGGAAAVPSAPAQAAAAARKKTGSLDITLLLLILILLTVGLVMLFSSSYVYAYYNDQGESFHYISRQAAFAAIGLVVMYIASRVDYHIFHRLALPVMAVSMLLLVVVLFTPKVKGVRRWIPIGPGFQPSEVAKFAVVIMFAQMITMYQKEMKTFKKGILPFISLLGAVALLMVLEPHLSGTILILSIGVIMMIIGGANLKWFAMAALVGLGGVVLAVLIPGVIPYAMDRLESWIDPFADPLGTGFQTIQSLYAIASGGLLGVGLGNSKQKFLYLPEPQNDFIFAIVCEELGFVGAVIIILLFVLLIWRGFVIALRAKDIFGTMIAVGLTAQVGVQAMLNIAVVTNTIPNTGISLPFFSYGGTALLMLLGQMGILLNISRSSTLEKE